MTPVDIQLTVLGILGDRPFATVQRILTFLESLSARSRPHTIHYTTIHCIASSHQMVSSMEVFLSAPAVIPTASWYYSDARIAKIASSTWHTVSPQYSAHGSGSHCGPCRSVVVAAAGLRPKRRGESAACHHIPKMGTHGNPPEQSQPARNTVADTSAHQFGEPVSSA